MIYYVSSYMLGSCHVKISPSFHAPMRLVDTQANLLFSFPFLFLFLFFFFFNSVHRHGCHMSAESHLTAFETNPEVTTVVRVHPVAKTDSEAKAGR